MMLLVTGRSEWRIRGKAKELGVGETSDYGTITLTADRPLVLENATTHQFPGDSSRLIVKPAHKRAIVVRVKSSHGSSEQMN